MANQPVAIAGISVFSLCLVSVINGATDQDVVSGLADCGLQESCIDISMTRIARNSVSVCLSWDSSKEGCWKQGPISQACYSRDESEIVNDWFPGLSAEICIVLPCGDVAQFGVQDGSGCSGSKSMMTTTIDGIAGSCRYDGGFCGGGSQEDCTWSFPIQCNFPTNDPTLEPTTEPSASPTGDPTVNPTMEPSEAPTASPTTEPTTDPTTEPTPEPSPQPTPGPTPEPTTEPTTDPTSEPSAEPTVDRSVTPPRDPDSESTLGPSLQPKVRSITDVPSQSQTELIETTQVTQQSDASSTETSDSYVVLSTESSSSSDSSFSSSDSSTSSDSDSFEFSSTDEGPRRPGKGKTCAELVSDITLEYKPTFDDKTVQICLHRGKKVVSQEGFLCVDGEMTSLDALDTECMTAPCHEAMRGEYIEFAVQNDGGCQSQDTMIPLHDFNDDGSMYMVPSRVCDMQTGDFMCSSSSNSDVEDNECIYQVPYSDVECAQVQAANIADDGKMHHTLLLVFLQNTWVYVAAIAGVVFVSYVAYRCITKNRQKLSMSSRLIMIEESSQVQMNYSSFAKDSA